MERWLGRVAVVTGASAGIGAAIAYQLQDHGLHVVGLARRAEKIEDAVKKSRQEAKYRNRHIQTKATPGKLYSRKCDLQKEEDILSAFKWTKDTLGRVDILVNNGGAFGEKSLIDTPTEQWRALLDVNVLGLSICTREAVKIMREKGVTDGHIVHINSVPMDSADTLGLSMNMYFASKHAVTALTEGLRKDFVEHKEKLRVTGVFPGFVLTESAQDALQVGPDYNEAPFLRPEDIADAVVYAIGTPPHVQIHQIIIRPVGER